MPFSRLPAQNHIMAVRISRIAKRAAMFFFAISLLYSAQTASTIPVNHPEQMRRSELRKLLAVANGPSDFQRLASYFHYQEQVNRAKADLEMHDYAKYYSRYHPKQTTHSDKAARLFAYYSAKAHQDAELAQKYDAKLVSAGIQPLKPIQSLSLVELQNKHSFAGKR